jgi:hypothetical protein
MPLEVDRIIEPESVAGDVEPHSTFDHWWRATFEAAVRVSNYHAASMNAKVTMLRAQAGVSDGMLSRESST